MNDWNIQTRSRACQACGRGFADGERLHTLLFENRAGLERLDVCNRCWEEQHQHGASDRKGFVSHWQGVFILPPPAPPEPIRRDSAESLLRRLTELNDPCWHPAAFILAVMLERKRVLKTRDQRTHDSVRTLVYEMPRTGELFVVPDPGLRLDQLEHVQRDVAQLLERGLPGDLSRDPPPASDPERASAGAVSGIASGPPPIESDS
jgi:hypothetical protein